MYAYIKGTLTHSSPTYVIIDAHGVGYRISIPTSVFSLLPQIGDSLLLHTLQVIREFSHVLYGFSTANERDLFEVLMGVSGIGPKLALSLISHLSLPDMKNAFNQADLATICRVPGIGKKTAERLVVEMRDKLNNLFPIDPSDLSVQLPSQAVSGKISDAMNALINLGYNQATAQKALKKSLSDLPEDVDLASLITTALKFV